VSGRLETGSIPTESELSVVAALCWIVMVESPVSPALMPVLILVPVVESAIQAAGKRKPERSCGGSNLEYFILGKANLQHLFRF
jgi:hypothetical protein